MKFKFLVMLALTFVLSVIVSSKGYSGCDTRCMAACNNKCVETVTHTDAVASDMDILEMSPINQVLML